MYRELGLRIDLVALDLPRCKPGLQPYTQAVKDVAYSADHTIFRYFELFSGSATQFDPSTARSHVFADSRTKEVFGRKLFWVYRGYEHEERSVLLLLAAMEKADCRYGFAYVGQGARWDWRYAAGHSIDENVCIDFSEMENIAWWGTYADLHEKHYLLRDIYPISFLSKRHLDLPIESTTLGHWLRSNGDRGRLEPFNDDISLWRVKRESVGMLRERLFRAGLLFYYRYFQGWDPNNQWATDFDKPFHAPAEIPLIFQSNYVRVTDRQWIADSLR